MTIDHSVSLSVDSILHSSGLDSVLLTQANVLSVQELISSQLLEGELSLLSDVTLNVGRISNNQSISNIVWIELITPSDRIYLVGSNSTTYSTQ